MRTRATTTKISGDFGYDRDNTIADSMGEQAVNTCPDGYSRVIIACFFTGFYSKYPFLLLNKRGNTTPINVSITTLKV